MRSRPWPTCRWRTAASRSARRARRRLAPHGAEGAPMTRLGAARAVAGGAGGSLRPPRRRGRARLDRRRRDHARRRGPSSPAWLLAGWMASRLGWTLAAREGASFRFRAAGRSPRVVFVRAEAVSAREVTDVRVRAGGAHPWMLASRVRERGDTARLDLRSPREVALEIPSPGAASPRRSSARSSGAVPIPRSATRRARHGR